MCEGVVVVVPAKNEAELLPLTLLGLRQVRGVQSVVVVDDGSHDTTAQIAADLGAHVIRRTASRGKAAALTAGVEYAGAFRDSSAGILLLDADVGPSVKGLGPVLEPLLDGTLDLVIAKYIARGSAGGSGRVVRAARNAIKRQSGWSPEVPLSGIRALSWTAWDSVLPLAPGWGVEVGMTLDALAARLRVGEVDTPLTHRATGSDWHAQMHRARQYRDVQRAVLTRRASGLSTSGRTPKQLS